MTYATRKSTCERLAGLAGGAEDPAGLGGLLSGVGQRFLSPGAQMEATCEHRLGA